MIHRPYSPRLVPNNYFLFPFIKNKMCCHRFKSSEEAVEAYKCHVFALLFSESGINVLKISLFECKSALILEKSLLRRIKTNILSEKLFLALFSKNLSTTPHTNVF